MILTNTQEYNILYVQSGCCSHHLIMDSNTRTQPFGKSYNLGWRIVTAQHGEMMKASYVSIASCASQDCWPISWRSGAILPSSIASNVKCHVLLCEKVSITIALDNFRCLFFFFFFFFYASNVAFNFFML